MTARTLDHRHFTLLSRQIQGDKEFQAYRVKHPASTIILFSVEDGQPIAGISVLPKEKWPSSSNAKMVVTKRNQAPILPQEAIENGYGEFFFQALSNVDNEEFDIAIHNLTDFVSHPNTDLYNDSYRASVGYVKIDILGQAIDVRDTDYPLIGINQVNELRPSESYTISSDQRTGHKTMVLRGAIDQKTGAAISVKEDENMGAINEKTQGSYFFVNVVGSANFPQLTKMLAQTVWRAADVFVRSIPKDNGRQRNAFRAFDQESTTFNRRNLTMGKKKSSQVVAMGCSAAEQSAGDQTHTMPFAYARKMVAPRSIQTAGGSSHGFTLENHLGYSQNRYVGAAPSQQAVQSSQAGQVLPGNNIVQVNSHQTGIQYNYDVRGQRFCLGLSVWREMPLLETLTDGEALHESVMLMAEFVDNGNRNLLAQLAGIYKQDECVICMAAEPKQIFLQCGHQCVCENCCGNSVVKQNTYCYLCRGKIVARIMAE